MINNCPNTRRFAIHTTIYWLFEYMHDIKPHNNTKYQKFRVIRKESIQNLGEMKNTPNGIYIGGAAVKAKIKGLGAKSCFKKFLELKSPELKFILKSGL